MAATSRPRCARSGCHSWTGIPLWLFVEHDLFETGFQLSGSCCDFPSSIARQDHVLDDRIDLVFPALAGEHAVMAGAGLHVVALEIGAQLLAEVVCRDGLADCADVIALALNGQQLGAPDRARIDGFTAPFQPAER